MQYEIVASGSRGNCVTINDVMVDCGVPYKRIENHLYDIRYLLITHIHNDHINPTTLSRIKKMFPKITIIGNHEVHQMFGVDMISNEGYPLKTDHYTFLPFLCEHDVLTHGFVWEYEGKRIIYATDTSSMDYAPEGVFDYFFIESNHCEQKLEQARGKRIGGYDPYLSGKRHLSTQQAKAFYYMRRRDKDSEFIELHKSSRFY